MQDSIKMLIGDVKAVLFKLLLLVVLFAVVSLGAFIYYAFIQPKPVEVIATIKRISHSSIQQTKTTTRSRGRTTSVTTSKLAIQLDVEYQYGDSIYEEEIKRSNIAIHDYKVGDTLHIRAFLPK